MPLDSQVGLFERVHTFQVTAGTTYDILCQQFFGLLDENCSIEGNPAGVEKTSFVMDRVRDHISHQLPSKNHQVFPREKCTSDLPYASIAELKEELFFPLPSRTKAEPPARSSRNLPMPLSLLWPRPPGFVVTGIRLPLQEIMIDREVRLCPFLIPSASSSFIGQPPKKSDLSYLQSPTTLGELIFPPSGGVSSLLRSVQSFFSTALVADFNCGTRGHSLRRCPERLLSRSNALNSAIGASEAFWRDWQSRIANYRPNRSNRAGSTSNHHGYDGNLPAGQGPSLAPPPSY